MFEDTANLSLLSVKIQECYSRKQFNYREIISNFIHEIGLVPNECPGLIESFSKDVDEIFRNSLTLDSSSFCDYLNIFMEKLRFSFLSSSFIPNFFEFLKDTLIASILTDINKSQLEASIANFLSTYRTKHRYFTLTQQQALFLYNNIVYKDNFKIWFTVIICQYFIPKLLIECDLITIGYVNDLDHFKQNYLPYILNDSYPPESILILRSNCFTVFYNNSHSIFYLIKTKRLLDKKPPTLIPQKDLSFFKELIVSNVVKESLKLFLEEGLRLGNQKHCDVDEGFIMLNYAFDHIINSGNIFYTSVEEGIQGFNICDFVFIKKQYKSKEFIISQIMENERQYLRSIALLHEACKIYQRIYPGCNFTSPSSNYTEVINGKIQEKSEDGDRFERILFPDSDGLLYDNTMGFLTNVSSWNVSLEEFRSRFQSLQTLGKTRNSHFIRTKPYNKNSPGMVKCGNSIYAKLF